MTGARLEPLFDAMVSTLAGSGPATVAAYLDDRSRLHMPGVSGMAGDYEGREAICALLQRMTTATEDSLRFETVCTTAGNGGYIRLCGAVSGGRGNRALKTAATLEAVIVGLLIREAWLTCADQPAWDAFWS